MPLSRSASANCWTGQVGLAGGVALRDLDAFDAVIADDPTPDRVVEIEDQAFPALAAQRGDHAGDMVRIERQERRRKTAAWRYSINMATCHADRPTVSASPATSSSMSPVAGTLSASASLMRPMMFSSVPGSDRSRLPKRRSGGGASV